MLGRLLTVGSTVDEAAALYTLFERACQVQILAESTGLEKVFVSDEEAEYTRKAAIDPVSLLHTINSASSKLIILIGSTLRRFPTRLELRDLQIQGRTVEIAEVNGYSVFLYWSIHHTSRFSRLTSGINRISERMYDHSTFKQTS